MGRVKTKTASKIKKASKKVNASAIHKKKRIEVFANFIVDRIIEEQRNGVLLSKDISDK